MSVVIYHVVIVRCVSNLVYVYCWIVNKLQSVHGVRHDTGLLLCVRPHSVNSAFSNWCCIVCIHALGTSQRSVGLGATSSENFAHLSSRWWWKLQELQLLCLFPAGWIIAIRCSTGCWTLSCTSCSLCRMPVHDWSLARDAVIMSHCCCQVTVQKSNVYHHM